MDNIPLTLLVDVSENERDTVLRWWGQLTDEARREIIQLYNPQREECFFGPPIECEEQPVVIGGCFLAEDDVWRFADWEADWREYLYEHPDVFLLTFGHSKSYRYGDGALNVWVEWGRTRFRGTELPPSEQYRTKHS